MNTVQQLSNSSSNTMAISMATGLNLVLGYDLSSTVLQNMFNVVQCLLLLTLSKLFHLELFPSKIVTVNNTRKLCYRKDGRVMRPI